MFVYRGVGQGPEEIAEKLGLVDVRPTKPSIAFAFTSEWVAIAPVSGDVWVASADERLDRLDERMFGFQRVSERERWPQHLQQPVGLGDADPMDLPMGPARIGRFPARQPVVRARELVSDLGLGVVAALGAVAMLVGGLQAMSGFGAGLLAVGSGVLIGVVGSRGERVGAWWGRGARWVGIVVVALGIAGIGVGLINGAWRLAR